MAGLGLGHLPMPPHSFRPDLIRGPAGDACMDTRDEAAAEDQLRVRLLSSKNFDPPIDEDERHRLAAELSRRRPQTLASSRFIRRHKLRIIGNLMQVDAESRRNRSRTFTAIPVGWSCSSCELTNIDPRRLIAAFRSDLNRCGGSSASGCLMAFVHGEYEPGRIAFSCICMAMPVGG